MPRLFSFVWLAPPTPQIFTDRHFGKRLMPGVEVTEVGHAGRPAFGVLVRQLCQRLRRPDADAGWNLGDLADAITDAAAVVHAGELRQVQEHFVDAVGFDPLEMVGQNLENAAAHVAIEGVV